MGGQLIVHSQPANMYTKIAVIALLAATAQALPRPQAYRSPPSYDYYDAYAKPVPLRYEDGPEEFKVEDFASGLGQTLNKLPNVLSKTADWIKDFAAIGDDVHPEVGSSIRQGADWVKLRSKDVPEDLNLQLQGHLNKLIDLVKGIQGSVVDGLEKAPGAVADLDDPFKDYAQMVVDAAPSAQEVDSEIQEAIKYLEPLADALGTSTTEKSR